MYIVNSKVEWRSIYTNLAKPKKILWIDMVTAPDVPFFKSIIKEIIRRDIFKIYITGRKYLGVPKLIKKYNLTNAVIIDSFWGKSNIAKIASIFFRTLLLIKFAFNKKISIGFSFCSRPQTIAAWILRIPMVNMDDYEFGDSTLIIPFSHTIFIPEELSHLKNNKIKIYPELKESIYAFDFEPNTEEIINAGIDIKKVVIIIRMNSIFAHYQHKSIDKLLDIQLINYLSKLQGVCTVVLPRYNVQKNEIKKLIINSNIVILEQMLNGQNLIWHSDGVVSGGGSMIREAVCLNKPAYDIFGGKLGEVEKKLINIKKVIKIYNSNDFSKIIIKKQHARKKTNPDPKLLNFIIENIQNIAI